MAHLFVFLQEADEFRNLATLGVFPFACRPRQARLHMRFEHAEFDRFHGAARGFQLAQNTHAILAFMITRLIPTSWPIARFSLGTWPPCDGRDPYSVIFSPIPRGTCPSGYGCVSNSCAAVRCTNYSAIHNVADQDMVALILVKSAISFSESSMTFRAIARTPGVFDLARACLDILMAPS